MPAQGRTYVALLLPPDTLQPSSALLPGLPLPPPPPLCGPGLPLPSPPFALLLYFAWRRGAALGSPRPVLLLPPPLAMVAAELAALEPRGRGGEVLASYHSFVADMGMW